MQTCVFESFSGDPFPYNDRGYRWTECSKYTQES